MVFSCVPFSNVTVCRAIQLLKAPTSIVSTLAGISIELNGHSVNAVSPIVFKREFFANTRTDKFRQLPNADFPIVSTLAGISIELNGHP